MGFSVLVLTTYSPYALFVSRPRQVDKDNYNLVTEDEWERVQLKVRSVPFTFNGLYVLIFSMVYLRVCELN